MNKKIIIVVCLLVACTKKQPAEIKSITEGAKTGPSTRETKKVSDARFLKILGSVEHKRAGERVWEGSELQTPLYLLDWVKTGDNSSTAINLFEKRKIELDEGAIVVLMDREDSQKVKKAIVAVSKGEVRGEVGLPEQGTNELIFKLPSAWVKVTSSLKEGVKKIVRLSLSEDRYKVHAEKGDVEILWQDKKQVVKASTSFEAPMPQEVEIAEIVQQQLPPKQQQEVKVAASNEDQATKIKDSQLIARWPSQFKIVYPSPGTSWKKASIEVRMDVPKGHEIYFKGKQVKVKAGKAEVDVPLRLGTNRMTFQVIKGESVKYHSVEVERQ